MPSGGGHEQVWVVVCGMAGTPGQVVGQLRREQERQWLQLSQKTAGLGQ